MPRIEPQPNLEKLKQLVIYIANKSKDDENFGMIKLNKLLYFSDFEAYRMLGKSITEIEYRKLEEGPVPFSIQEAMDELSDFGLIKVEQIRRFKYTQFKTIPTAEADTELFAPEELEIVDRIIEQYKHFNATEISNASHDRIYNIPRMYAKIPYQYALISTGDPSEAAIQAFKDIVELEIA